jgi:hypothetical protein
LCVDEKEKRFVRRREREAPSRLALIPSPSFIFQEALGTFVSRPGPVPPSLRRIRLLLLHLFLVSILFFFFAVLINDAYQLLLLLSANLMFFFAGVFYFQVKMEHHHHALYLCGN